MSCRIFTVQFPLRWIILDILADAIYLAFSEDALVIISLPHWQSRRTAPLVNPFSRQRFELVNDRAERSGGWAGWSQHISSFGKGDPAGRPYAFRQDDDAMKVIAHDELQKEQRRF